MVKKIAKYADGRVKEMELHQSYYACYKRFMDAADFTDVKWTMEYFSRRNGSTLFRILATYKKNPTRWMKAIKTARGLGKQATMVSWKYGTRFSFDFRKKSITVVVRDDGVNIEFHDEGDAILFCRRHKIKNIARRKLETSYNDMIKKVELDRLLSKEFTDKIFGGK